MPRLLLVTSPRALSSGPLSPLRYATRGEGWGEGKTAPHPVFARLPGCILALA
jgi:hypothetical protein